LLDDCANRKRLNDKGCYSQEDRYSCLTSSDGRGMVDGLNMFGAACVWCPDGCTDGSDTKCEPKLWLNRQDNKKNYDYCLSVVPGTQTPCAERKIINDGKGCYTMQDRQTCLTSLDGRSGGPVDGIALHASDCVWCQDGCTPGGSKCEPKAWVDGQSNKKPYEYCLPDENAGKSGRAVLDEKIEFESVIVPARNERMMYLKEDESEGTDEDESEDEEEEASN